jgi:F420-non-reducing hydrogenase iron-sulfur subunit
MCQNVPTSGNRLPYDLENFRKVREMVVQTIPGKVVEEKRQHGVAKPQITIFHCVNALGNAAVLDFDNCDIKSIKLPCSSLNREVVLLKAFEAGADAVVVLVCPEGTCRYLQGNLRTAKRVSRIKKLLDEIGLDGRRLNLYNIAHGDVKAAEKIIENTLTDLVILGPNPAA